MNRVTWKWIPIIVFLLGCAYYLHQINAKYHYPSEYLTKNFPTFRQPDQISCGPTSLQMVLKHRGNPQPLSEIRKQTCTDLLVTENIELGGTTPEFMQIALDHYGIPCTMETANMERLKWQVSQGLTPVALVRSGYRFWHWVVVIGYNEKDIIIADPGSGAIESIPSEIFRNAWNFNSDIYGQNVVVKCPACNGDGQIEWLGIFGRCDLCNGSGSLPDWWWKLVELGEMRGNILIVPKTSPSNVT